MVLEQNYEDTFTLNSLSVTLGNIVAATWNLPKLQHEKLAFKVWNSDRRHIGIGGVLKAMCILWII